MHYVHTFPLSCSAALAVSLTLAEDKEVDTYAQQAHVQLACTYACTYARTHTHSHTRTHSLTHSHTHTHTCARTRTHAHTHARTHTCARARAHTHTHTLTYWHTYTLYHSSLCVFVFHSDSLQTARFRIPEVRSAVVILVDCIL